MRLQIAGRSHIFRPLAALAAVFFVSITLMQVILVNGVRREIDARLADAAAAQSDRLDGRLEDRLSHLKALGIFALASGSPEQVSEYIQNDEYLASLKNLGAAGIDGGLVFGAQLPEAAKLCLETAYHGHPVVEYARWGDGDMAASLLLASPVFQGDNVVGAVYGFLSGVELDDVLFAGEMSVRGQAALVSRDRHNYIFPLNTPPEGSAALRELRSLDNDEEIGRLYWSLFKNEREIARVDCGGKTCYFAAATSRILKDWYFGLLVSQTTMRDTVVPVVFFTAGTFVLLMILFIAVFFYIINAGEKQREKLRRAAYMDPLTGLPKWEQLRQDEDWEPDRESGVLALFDLDSFDRIRLALGTDQGDGLLKNIANLLSRELDKDDIIARASGDRFLLYTRGHSQIRERLLFISDLISQSSGEYPLTVTAGAAALEDGLTLEAGYERAAAACETARRQKLAEGVSRNLVVMYDGAVEAEAQRRQTLRGDFESAFIKEDFQPLLQPLKTPAGDEWAAAELLMRWNHAKYGVVDVREFLDYPAEGERRTRLDGLMLDAACRLIRQWLNDGRRVYPVAVNLSQGFLLREDVAEKILSIMELYQVSPEYLLLEIPESAFAPRSLAVRAAVRKLGTAGFTLIVSRFGFDGGLLPEFTNLPVKWLKVDNIAFGQKISAAGQGFKPEKDDDRQEKISDLSVQILEDLVTLAGHLGIKVIVSGVDTLEERLAAQKTGCALIQGFSCARPLTVPEYEAAVYGGDRQ